jgi:hypothetical protein
VVVAVVVVALIALVRDVECLADSVDATRKRKGVVSVRGTFAPPGPLTVYIQL